MDLDGISMAQITLWRTVMDVCGLEAHDLQNRLRGAVEASWVGSMPIHPRQFWPVSKQMTAKMTATHILADHPP